MKALVCLAAAFLAAPTTAAVAQEYVPEHVERAGVQIVALYIGSSTCVANSNANLGPAVRAIKAALAGEAKRRGGTFTAVGVALDWDLQEGIDYLLHGRSKVRQQDFGAWDEIDVGNNWLNQIAVHRIWRDSAGRGVTPQLLILERDVNPEGRTIQLGADRVLVRLMGNAEIANWANAGSRLEAANAR